MKKKGCLYLIAGILILSIIVSLLPKSSNLLYNEADSSFKTGNYQEAIKRINEAITLDSLDSKLYEHRAEILHELHDTLHSELDFEKSLQISSSDSIKDERLKEIFEWNVDHGNTKKAKSTLKKELELYKDDKSEHLEAQKFVANQFLILKDTIESLKIYEAIAQEHNLPEYHNRSGIININRKKYNQSITNFKKAIKLSPENETYIYNLGIAYLNKDSKSNAKTQFKKAMDLGSKDACRKYRELTAITKYNKKSRCCDGSTSSAMGRGACSHHGGVCGYVNIPYKKYTINCY